MIHFRKLLPTITLALLILQVQQQLHGDGFALARPVQPDGTEAGKDVFASQPGASSPGTAANGVTTVEPEAVLKALQSLANGIQTHGDGDNQQPILVISHGDGGPINADASNKANGENNDSNDSKDASNDDQKPKQVKSPSKSNDQSSKSSHNPKTDPKKPSNSTQTTLNALQQPRTRFCAQAANTNHTIDEISQKLVKAERQRLATIRKQRESKASSSSKTNATDARSLTDAKILAEQAKTVQVVWHVIHSGRAGNLSQAMINDQIQTLNEDYKAYGFAFNLNDTDRVNNTEWFRDNSPDSQVQTEMKSALRKGDEKTLNLYSVDFGNGLLGYSSFPWDVKDNLTDDGIVFQYSTVPGGSETGYNLGKTVTHEVGHWLGLYHVFQGGCEAPGDYVDDTPPQNTATSGCPVGQDSCKGGGVDSIHNYMDYSSDACLTQFTEGQAVRMAALTGQYRSL